MKNYLLCLRFDGSAFHGSQRQKNATSIQKALENALSVILRQDTKIKMCSRTDAGVHANMFCVNFFTDVVFDSSKLVCSLNGILPRSVAVYGITSVKNDFNAQKSCISKEYIYKIWNSSYRNPFLENYALHFTRELDVDLLNGEAKAFSGEHDFAAFCASGSNVSSTVRTIYDASLKRDGELVTFTVRGNGFLYNMVRIMTGTLLDIANGKIERGNIHHIINSKDRNLAGATAPSKGLYLNRVFYPEDI